MMEESDYLGYDEEPLFAFDNELDEAATMDQVHLLDDDVDHEPLTPYGSAGASAPGPVQAPRAGDGRLHLSSATAWQDPAAHSSPPALSHSPSPRAPAPFQYRQQDSRVPSRYTSRRNSTHHQHDRPDLQASRQNLGQAAYPPIDVSARRRELQQVAYHDKYERPQPHEASPPPASPGGPHNLEEEPDLINLNPSTSTTLNPIPIPNPGPEQEYVMIPAEEVEAMFNGNEESRITAQKFKDQVVNATVQNGKVVYMVGQATVEWWMSSDMQKRRRAAGRKMLDVGGAVVSGAGSLIMTSTPLGRVCDSVSTNVTAFKAAPFSYTMKGLGVMKKTSGATLANEGIASTGGKHTSFEPAIADEDALVEDWEDDDDDFDGGMSMGMGMFNED